MVIFVPLSFSYLCYTLIFEFDLHSIINVDFQLPFRSWCQAKGLGSCKMASVGDGMGSDGGLALIQKALGDERARSDQHKQNYEHIKGQLAQVQLF